MTVRLTTTVKNIEKKVFNQENREIILRFFEFMKRNGTSERYQNNNLKAIIGNSKFLGSSILLDQVKSKSQVISLLDTKIKPTELDPE